MCVTFINENFKQPVLLTCSTLTCFPLVDNSFKLCNVSMYLVNADHCLDFGVSAVWAIM